MRSGNNCTAPPSTCGTAAMPERWWLLRGLGRESAHWGDFPQLLQRRLASGDAPIAQVESLDLPGVGQRRHRPSPSRVEAMVDELHDAVEASRQEHGIAHYLVALSLGSMVAIDWLLRFPGDLQGVVLVNPSSALSPWWRRLRPGGLAALLGAALAPNEALQERRILACVSNDEARRRAVLAPWVRIAVERPVRRADILRQLVAARRFDLRRYDPTQLAEVAAQRRALLLASRADRLVSSHCSTDLAAFTGWPVRYHDTAGHDLCLDDPTWVAEAIAQWRTAQRRLSRAPL